MRTCLVLLLLELVISQLQFKLPIAHVLCSLFFGGQGGQLDKRLPVRDTVISTSATISHHTHTQPPTAYPPKLQPEMASPRSPAALSSGNPRPIVAIGPSSGPEPPFPLRVSGPVVKGFGRGSKELQIPTANIPVEGLNVGGCESVESGVYFGWAGLDLEGWRREVGAGVVSWIFLLLLFF